MMSMGLRLSIRKFLSFSEVRGVKGSGAIDFSVKFDNLTKKENAFSVGYFLNSVSLERYNYFQKLGTLEVDGYEAEKRFIPKQTIGSPDDMIVLVVTGKRIVITFNDKNFSNVSGTNIDQILSTFKFIK